MIRNITILLLLSMSHSATLLVPNEYSTIQSAINAGDPESELDPDGTITDMGAFYFDQSSFCNDGYADIDGYCYYQSDLDVLQILIDNSSETIYMDMDDNGNGNIEPLELGQQEWDEGRISQLSCSWTDGGWQMCEVSGPIPDEIGNLVKLTELDFYGNNLSGEIPSEIGNLVLLEYLKLTSNQLSGEIPQEIWTLTNLIRLQLGSNQLTGEIPPEIGNLINLETLTLGTGNQFSGTILDKIENLVNLKWLTIEYVGFTGEIPDYIGDFTNLVGLILHHNQLTGEVPDNLWNLTNISRIELGDNQLTGEIPSEIGNFENLQTLYLHNTGFSGLIPESLCDLDLNWDFYWNNISTCKFCPPYPECLTEEEIGYQDISECQEISGCMDENACNYDETANVDDGSCSYIADGTCDCSGNELDQCGECGGPGIPDGECDCEGNVVDQCNECGGSGDGNGDGLCDNDGTPLQFVFNQSPNQAFYLFTNVTIDGIPVEANDWVGAFRGDVCVGARVWDTSVCGEGICDIAVMGDDGSAPTDGYMLTGDIPTFKIYDASNNTYLDAVVSEDIEGWSSGGFQYGIEFLQNVILGCMDENACNYESNANADDGSCEFASCTDGCDNGVTISNQWSDGYHYDFTYTLGELQVDELYLQTAQREITSLTVTCQETGQEWIFDSNRIAGGNGNHDISYLQEQYEHFPFPERDITNGLLMGFDTQMTGNYHLLTFSVSAIDDNGNDFYQYHAVDFNPYGMNPLNDVMFSELDITDTVDYSNLDIFYAEGMLQYSEMSLPVVTYAIGDVNMGFICDDTCEGSLSGSDCEDSIELSLHEGSNLMSFAVLPEDHSIDNVLTDPNISAIAGEGEAALNTDNGWVGSLTTIFYERGYWLLAYEAGILNLSGNSIDPDQLYALHAGSNLISYPLADCGSIDEVLPDDIEDCIYAIAGEGMAAINTENGWVGSLTALCSNEGYWFVNQCDDISFTFDEPTSLARRQVLSSSPRSYNQSSQQAFYFIEFAVDIDIGDWILAYNKDKVIGARQWQGDIIDVPAMGDDGSTFTSGYIKSGTTPQFKLLKGDKLTELTGEVSTWSDNQIFMVKSLMPLPESFSLSAAYPNPFNPTTTLNFSIPVDSEVFLSVYNLQGREVATLINRNMHAGYHSVVWDASFYASGLYFVKMTSGEYIKNQKLMLVK